MQWRIHNESENMLKIFSMIIPELLDSKVIFSVIPQLFALQVLL